MSLFSRRVRGFRLIEVIGVGMLIATVLTVYLGKTFAGKERSQIASVEKEIALENERVRLLQAEVSYLEQPERLERLSTSYLGLQPISAKRETIPEALPGLAHPVAPAAIAPPQTLAAAAVVAPAPVVKVATVPAPEAAKSSKASKRVAAL